MKLPKSTTIRGKRYRIHDVHAPAGICDHPKLKGKCIKFPIHGDTLGELTVTVHELLHACFWDLDEEAIDEAAADIARTLWNLNWRKET